MTRGSRMVRAASVITLMVTAVALYFLALGLGYGYRTCSGGRVVERLPDGTPKRIVGPFRCTDPDYWPWLYVLILAIALALTGVVLTVIFVRRDMRDRREAQAAIADA